MTRPLLLFCLLLTVHVARAASGGPDAYGYIWRDSNEPNGPVFSWTDITTTGVLVQGLADDNIVGPFTMATDHPFYWYGRKNVWIGSNGYVAFNSGNIASPFPSIPLTGGVNDYIAGLTADYTFSGAGNPGRCYLYDDIGQTIISYVGVPYWSPTPPNYTGSNSFQIVLNKMDSTITIHYLSLSGVTQNNDLLIGIESVAGSIGLQHSVDQTPPSNFAIRFYMPASSELEIVDATVAYNTAPGSHGRFLSRNGSAFGLSTNVLNTGNVDLQNIAVQGAVRNQFNTVLASASSQVPSLAATFNANVFFDATFVPATVGTYNYTTTVSGIANELVTTNNSRTQELVVLDTTLALHRLTYAGPNDDGIGMSWNGGNGGIGVHLIPPYYPAYATATTVRIVNNFGFVGFSMAVYDDHGPNGGPGALLDSVVITAQNVTLGDMIIPLSEELVIQEGGVYVLWYMGGANISLGQDISPPFSLNTYEVLGGTWAEYRDRENVDFHIGLQLTQAPVPDIGVTGFFGTATGQNILDPITIRAWVTNLGSLPATGFSVNYQFMDGPVVTAPFTGSPIAAGEQYLFAFPQLFDPDQTTTGDLCAWSTWDIDADNDNDTSCVTVNVFVGLAEHPRAELRSWPNPANERAYISGLPPGPCTVELLDVSGRTVLRQQQTATPAAMAIELATLPAGHYTLLATQNGTRFTTRFIVQH